MHYLLNKLDEHVNGGTVLQSSFGVMDSWQSSTTHLNKILSDVHPHITADNHFPGFHVLNLAGEMGFGLTLTIHCDRFPKGLKPYFHHVLRLEYYLCGMLTLDW